MNGSSPEKQYHTENVFRKSMKWKTMIVYQQQECLGSGIFELLQLLGNAQFTYNLDNT